MSTGDPLLARHLRAAGFTLIELLLVIALVSIIASFGIATLVGWRADTLHREVTAIVEAAIVETREESRRQSRQLELVVDGDDASIIRRVRVLDATVQRQWQLPEGAVVLPDAGGAFEAIGFDGLLGAQEPYEVITWQVMSGSGRFQRTTVISVIPPLGLTAVRRP